MGDYMETIVRFIISLCLDYNINTGNIQESMLEMGRYIREYQVANENIEYTRAENERLSSEIKLQTSIAENYKALWDGYRKFAAGNVKDAKGEEEELAKRMVELEKELDKTSERYRTMFLKYSFAFERKDEYKDCYYKLKAASEKEKTRLENQKQKLEERIVSWKTKAELEENKRLKLTIDHKLAEQEVEAAEERSTELLVELTSIRLRHDTELNDIKKSYDKLIKEEKKKKEQLDKDVAEKIVEIKKQ